MLITYTNPNTSTADLQQIAFSDSLHWSGCKTRYYSESSLLRAVDYLSKKFNLPLQLDAGESIQVL